MNFSLICGRLLLDYNEKGKVGGVLRVFGFGIVIYIMLQFTVFDRNKTINAIMPESDIKINAGKETVLGYHLKKR